MLQLRSLSFHGTRSPQELLKASGLTQVWIYLVIVNASFYVFHFLIMLLKCIIIPAVGKIT